MRHRNDAAGPRIELISRRVKKLTDPAAARPGAGAAAASPAASAARSANAMVRTQAVAEAATAPGAAQALSD